MGAWGATPEAKQYVFGIVQFKHTHPRYPKTPLLAYGVQWYGCQRRHPRTQTIFLALCISNTPILGLQKHLCWPMAYSSMGVWGATPEPKQYFLTLSISNTPILGIQKHLFWPMVRRGMGVWAATPEPKQCFVTLSILNTPILGIQKHLC